MIDLKPLKAIALSLKEPVKTLILSEEDYITEKEYAIKARTWLKYLKTETTTAK
ncbi:MAG: hypothetical protein ACYDAP_01400 [Thermoplasmataceae archaeon]